MSFESLSKVVIYAILGRALRRFIDAVVWGAMVVTALAILWLVFWGRV